jgi:hypothetical protein
MRNSDSKKGVFVLSAIIQINSAHNSDGRELMWAILKLTTLPTPTAEITNSWSYVSTATYNLQRYT